MIATAEASTAELTDYEAEQVEEIAAWKAEHPNAISELFHKVAQPVARTLEQVIPDAIVQKAIEASYLAAERAASPEDLMRQAGVRELGEFLGRPLEECDRLARKVGGAALGIGTIEGALTGAGGVFTTALDIPLLFGLALRTIIKIGRCYGFPLDRPTDRAFVLGVFAAALSNSRERKQRILVRLRDIEELLLEEIQENLVVEEAASLLFQIEIFEEVPGVGAISGAFLNLAAIRRVDLTARHVFQERWLRANGKVGVIEPNPDANAGTVSSSSGWAGALARGLYASGYALGYGLALPALLWRRPAPQLAAS
jgi:hypothetical protein